MRYRRALIGSLLACVIVFPGLAVGATVSPTAAQTRAIIKAFGDPRAASSCLIVRLASSHHNHADVRVRTVKSCQKWAFNGANALKSVKDNRWKVVFEGSSYRCPVA